MLKCYIIKDLFINSIHLFLTKEQSKTVLYFKEINYMSGNYTRDIPNIFTLLLKADLHEHNANASRDANNILLTV